MIIERIDEGKEPGEKQYIVFKSGDIWFAGVYMGNKTATPFSMEGKQPPLFLINEWSSIRLWL